MDTWEWLLLIGIVILATGTGSAIADTISNAVSSIGTTGSLSPIQQIAAYASTAGFTGTDLVTAVAIALAESSGIPGKQGDINVPQQGAASYGLWQINSYWHPEFGPDFTVLYDPQVNANAAFQIYQRAGNSFSPWTGTYGNGIYLKFVPQVQADLASVAV